MLFLQLIVIISPLEFFKFSIVPADTELENFTNSDLCVELLTGCCAICELPNAAKDPPLTINVPS